MCHSFHMQHLKIKQIRDKNSLFPHIKWQCTVNDHRLQVCTGYNSLEIVEMKCCALHLTVQKKSKNLLKNLKCKDFKQYKKNMRKNEQVFIYEIKLNKWTPYAFAGCFIMTVYAGNIPLPLRLSHSNLQMAKNTVVGEQKRERDGCVDCHCPRYRLLICTRTCVCNLVSSSWWTLVSFFKHT